MPLVWILLLLTIRISSVAGMAAARQRADHRRHSSLIALPNAARFRVARPLEAPREHPSPEGREPSHALGGQGLNEDLVDRLRLVRSPGIGPVTYRQLIARFGSAGGGARRRARPRPARRRQGRRSSATAREAEREIARVEKLGARYLALGQGLYPRLLAELEDAPPLLIAKGNLNLLDRHGGGDRRRAQRVGRGVPLRARACPRPRASTTWSWCRAWPAGSTAPRTTGRWTAARSASSPAASTSSIRRRTRSGRRAIVRARPGARRNAAGDRAARPPFPLPQPDHRRDQRGHGGGRGGAAIRLADHRAAGRRGGARGDGGARARRSIRERRAATS